MAQKVKLILNPMADMGGAWKVADDLRPVLAEFGSADWSGTVYPTHATELARQAGLDGYDRVIALGGDGTVHEVVNGLMQVPAERRPVLGVVPVGSGNDFGYAIKAPKQAEQALRLALTGEPSAVDIGLLTDETGRKEFFDNTLGIGFDTVVTIRSHKLPVLRGFMMYLVAVLQTIAMNHNPAKFVIEGDEIKLQQESLMMTVCNGPREGGGFLIAPEAKNDDGIFEYALVKKCGRLTMLRMIPEFMNGTHMRFPEVMMGRSKSLTIQSDLPLYIHTDGEIFSGFGSKIHNVKIEMLPSELKVACGPNR